MEKVQTINLSKHFKSDSYSVEFEDDMDMVLFDVLVIKDGKISNKYFLDRMIEVADEAYDKVGLMSYSSTLCQRDDEQRLKAMKDLGTMLKAVKPIINLIEQTSARSAMDAAIWAVLGDFLNIDPAELIRIKNDWPILLEGATKPEGNIPQHGNLTETKR